MARMTPPVRRLEPGDLPGCVALAAARGWSPEANTWEVLFELGAVFGIREPDGEVIGTTAVTRFGGGAAIGMVLVAERYERRGFAGRMMERALEHAGADPVCLYATEYGRPLYERLGFAVTGAVTAHIGSWRADPAASGSRPATAADRDAIVALDAAALGVERPALVDCLDGFAEAVRVVERDGAVVGYGAIWRRVDSVHVGPVIARDDATARTLIADLAGPGDRLRLDLDDSRPELQSWAAERGLAPGPTSVSMVLGDVTADGAHRFAPFMQAVG
jgi:GNAT superfamily N-acetyltransferase